MWFVSYSFLFSSGRDGTLKNKKIKIKIATRSVIPFYSYGYGVLSVFF